MVYVPPNSPDIYHSNLRQYLYSFVSSSPNPIILGDFNYPDIRWDRLEGVQYNSSMFCDLLFELDICQYVKQSTHVRGNILDLVLAPSSICIQNLTVHNAGTFSLSSDHYFVSFTYNPHTPFPLPPQPSPYPVFNFHQADLMGLNDYLLEQDFDPCLVSNDVEYIWSYIKDIIYKGFDLYVPRKRSKTKCYPPWYSANIIHDCNKLKTLKKSLRPGSLLKRCRIEVLTSELNHKISEARATFEANLVMKNKDRGNAVIFRYLNGLSQSSHIPSNVHYDSISASTDGDAAELFNQYFFSIFNRQNVPLPPSSNPQATLDSISFSDADVHKILSSLAPDKAKGIDNIGPQILKACSLSLYILLSHLFAQSLNNSSIPQEWLIHLICPIHKSGDKSDVSNYRPISLLCTVSKVLERLVYNKIIDFISPQISNYQFGFLARRSSLHQLLMFLNSVFTSLLVKNSTDVIYLDIKKAFDSISHQSLISKLSTVGIRGVLLEWFSCYLTSRQQCVTIRGSISHFLPVLSGVPQGSILGPLLFILYINDLPLALQKALPLIFADDTKCITSIASISDCYSLQEDLNSLAIWSQQAGLLFNHNKCSLLRFGHNNPQFNYSINDHPIPERNEIKDLGVWLSSDLNWSTHYDKVCGKAYGMLALIRRNVSPQCSIEMKKVLYLCLVRSQLTYCSQLWRPRLIKDIISLERIQRRSTKFVLNDYQSDYKTRLMKLHLLPLMHFFECSDILFFIKNLKHPSPNFNMLDYVAFCSGPVSTRSVTSCKLQHRHTKSNKARFFYFNRLPVLWNSLPSIDLSLSFPSLKSSIYNIFWDHFIINFNSSLHCSFHLKCPCDKCYIN